MNKITASLLPGIIQAGVRSVACSSPEQGAKADAVDLSPTASALANRTICIAICIAICMLLQKVKIFSTVSGGQPLFRYAYFTDHARTTLLPGSQAPHSPEAQARELPALQRWQSSPVLFYQALERLVHNPLCLPWEPAGEGGQSRRAS